MILNFKFINFISRKSTIFQFNKCIEFHNKIKQISSLVNCNVKRYINNGSLKIKNNFFKKINNKKNYSLINNQFINNLIMDSRNQKEYFNITRSNSDIILTPKEGYDSVLIFMHGLGDSANGYLDFFKEYYRPIPSKMKVILLTAPIASVTINGGARMNSWYDILSFKREKGSISEEDVIKNSSRIQNTIETEAQSNQIKGKYKKIFIGGFSQGCCMALYVFMSFKESLGGVIGLSGLLFPFIELNENRKDVPIMLAHGKWDSVIPYQLSQESYQRLTEDRFNVKFHTFDDEHTIEESTMEEMKDFLTKLST